MLTELLKLTTGIAKTGIGLVAGVATSGVDVIENVAGVVTDTADNILQESSLNIASLVSEDARKMKIVYKKQKLTRALDKLQSEINQTNYQPNPRGRIEID